MKIPNDFCVIWQILNPCAKHTKPARMHCIHKRMWQSSPVATNALAGNIMIYLQAKLQLQQTMSRLIKY